MYIFGIFGKSLHFTDLYELSYRQLILIYLNEHTEDTI